MVDIAVMVRGRPAVRPKTTTSSPACRVAARAMSQMAAL